MASPKSPLRDESGAAAVEFALVLPVTVFLIIGSITLSLAIYANNCLHYAVDGAARYAGAYTGRNDGTYPSEPTVTAYANTLYKGPGAVPVFHYYAPAGAGNTCASTAMHQVRVQANYRVIAGVANRLFLMNASSCYPA